MLEFDFSIIVPTRGRPEPLIRLISSILKNVDLDKEHRIEFIFGQDIDSQIDPKILRSFRIYRKLFTPRQRGEFLTRDYLNPMAAMADGKYLWFLSDDCEVTTPKWDSRALALIKEDDRRIFLGDVYDTTRNFTGNMEYPGFPIISRAAFEALGFFFDPRIPCWGADKYTYLIYKDSNAIIDMREIEVMHHHILDDETSKNCKAMYEKFGSGAGLDYTEPINRLKEAIKIDAERTPDPASS